jgi:hypothetical protein
VHIAAAEWILRLPEGRGQELLDAGCKAVLLILWNHARWTEHRNATCEECYPSAATIAAHTGSTLKATRKRLARLAAAGWIRHERRSNREWGFALAWRVPFALPLEGDTPGGETPLPLQGPSTAPPGSEHCPSRGTKLSTNEDIEPSREHITAGEPAPVDGHPCTVADSPEVIPARVDPSPSGPPATPPPTGHSEQPDPRPSPPPGRARKRKAPAPKPGQTALDIGDPREPDDVGQLLEAHRLARANADVSEPAWPAKTSKRWASMRAGCRKAIELHGFAWCVAMLEWRAAVWARDPSQHAYSTVDVWRPACLDYAKRNMSAGQAPARASPRGLPVAPDAPDRTYHWK